MRRGRWRGRRARNHPRRADDVDKGEEARTKTKTKEDETSTSTARGLKPDEKFIDDEAMDVEEDWEKITHKRAERDAVRESSRPTRVAVSDGDCETSGMGAIAEGVDLDRGCDISAWLEFDLHPLLTRAIQDCGFTTPTPIQRECLHPRRPTARCDIIGGIADGEP